MNRAATVEARTALASNALARSDSPLPHRDRIAAAFGAYAVDGIRTTIGGAAGPTAAQLGARAFTVGDRIGFRSEPDLHLAAHEAAHVMQQRAGVQLSAEGRPGDLYERHADAVADAVVAGRSAEPVLRLRHVARPAPRSSSTSMTWISASLRSRRSVTARAMSTATSFCHASVAGRTP